MGRKMTKRQSKTKSRKLLNGLMQTNLQKRTNLKLSRKNWKVFAIQSCKRYTLPAVVKVVVCQAAVCLVAVCQEVASQVVTWVAMKLVEMTVLPSMRSTKLQEILNKMRIFIIKKK